MPLTNHPPLSTPQRVVAGLAHLFAVIPIWGLVADFWIWHTRREEHPELRFQVIQAFFVQAILLLFSVIFALAQQYFQLLHVLNESLSMTLTAANSWLWKGFFILLVLMVLWAAFRLRWRGTFEYPLLGPMLRRELQRADAEKQRKESE